MRPESVTNARQNAPAEQYKADKASGSNILMDNASTQGLIGCGKPHHNPAEGIPLFLLLTFVGLPAKRYGEAGPGDSGVPHWHEQTMDWGNCC